MKQLLGFLIGLIVAVSIMIPVFQELGLNPNKVILDLPEEWKAITNHKDTPDTMSCYLSRDTLHLLFINHLNTK